MHKIGEKIVAFLPPETIEPEAMAQIERISRMPFIFKHVAVMPDCHLGRGATVGTVIATERAIIPAAVGVDIGCGMIAVKTKFSRKDLPEDLSGIRMGIERRIPLSAGAFNQKLYPSAEKRVLELALLAEQAILYDKFSSKWTLALGSLGSGNHFIEISLDENGQVWAFLHSGSRGIGNKIATHHIEIAKKLMELYHIKLEDPDLAYLAEGTREFDDYIRDMRWAQHFALLNREEMMDRVLTELSYAVYGENRTDFELERINCHHNFTQMESVCSTCIDILGNDNRKRELLLADPLISKVRDFLVDCLFLRHSCGGLLLSGAIADPESFALLNDALGRMEKNLLFVHCQELLQGHSHVAISYMCSCVSPNGIDVTSHKTENMSDLGFVRLFGEGKESHKLDNLLSVGFGVSVAYKNIIECLPSHVKRSVWLTRKGAINASEGALGLIPGSMGTRSYVVAGKGNVASFNSAPHGAGRNFSRTEARRRFNMADLEKAMEGKEWRKTDAFIDEVPQAYKNVEDVMENAKDLVEIRHTFEQIINVKGD